MGIFCINLCRSPCFIFLKFIAFFIYLLQSIKCFIKFINLFELRFSSFRNFIIADLDYYCYPRILTLKNLADIPLLFICFNIAWNSLAILLSSHFSSFLLPRSSLFLSSLLLKVLIGFLECTHLLLATANFTGLLPVKYFYLLKIRIYKLFL